MRMSRKYPAQSWWRKYRFILINELFYGMVLQYMYYSFWYYFWSWVYFFLFISKDQPHVQASFLDSDFYFSKLSSSRIIYLIYYPSSFDTPSGLEKIDEVGLLILLPPREFDWQASLRHCCRRLLEDPLLPKLSE